MNLRAAVLGSLLLHGGLLAAYGGGLFRTPARAPAPAVIRAEIPREVVMEMDLPDLEPDLLEVPAGEEGLPDPLDPPSPVEDPRFLESSGPPGPPEEIVGVSAIDGRRRRLPGAGGSGGRGPAPEPPPPAVEPPPPDPVFLPPGLKEDRAPAYPPEMRRRGIEGKVRVRVEVGPDGRVRKAEVAVSSGHPALDEAAVEAAAAWVFSPATEDGIPVAATVYRFVTFGLIDGR